MSNPVTEFLWNINSEVAKMSTASLSRVEEVLAEAEKELTKDLAKWMNSRKGDDCFTPQVYRNALVQIRGALDHINNSTDDGMSSALQYGGVVAAKLATSHLIKEVQTFSGMFEHSVRPIPFQAAALVADGQKLLYKHFTNSAHRYAGQVGEDIRKQLAIGLVRGETIDQLTDRLAKLGGPKGYVYLRGRPGSPGARAEVISEGLFRRYRHWAERLAVTETVNAYNQTAMLGMDELEEHDPGYFRRWDAAIDGRTCKFCGRYDDLVVPLDGKFPGGINAPPLHPRCRCAVVVWRKEWKESNYKDDLVKETIKGKEPKGVASIPHVIKTPEAPPKKEKKKQKPPKPVLKEEPAPKSAQNLQPISLDKFNTWREDYWKKLTKPEVSSCMEYGGSGYGDINGYLRKAKGKLAKSKKELNEHIENIDKALQKSVAPESMMVYRGTRKDIVGNLKPGQVLQDHGYMSTTCDKDATEMFRRKAGCLFQIEVPKGARIGPIPTGLPEAELLLPRGSKLEILEITKDADGMKIVKCRVVYE